MPALGEAEQRRRVAAARVGRLATLRPDGTPRLVPITFVLVEGLLFSAVDEVKPKRHGRLARLADIERDPRAVLLVDHYAEDWTRLWWVRIDGLAVVHTGGALRTRALDALVAKYPPYRDARPAGPVLALTPTVWVGWSAS
ncbi:TIGR03668 family PPOX class F420-dependent oxidoreductase [Pseudonocardia asaccharolytica]|uniref:PPOX class F420-dependent oxidoreductase n=1 Tax=Pseudonocardia asaccharolytica DSM 44247 = NBRC 16224 TaxID=1123024 RepID=A0A511CZU3_9PSEU|nr:TIGR03668 family PPOX class F420-dependent oxidoreductase [Pseudonocardia asaccharolytica]GEL18061.1 PPOX class F420-dependent oxidoreductase [Pseudonocardia asaccharolytica DSM 44247 = NBRC 16224]